MPEGYGDNIYGGAFPWSNLFGVSGMGGGLSEEDAAWQAYLDYSGLPQAGASGADYLNNFLPQIDTNALSAEMADSDIDVGGLPSLAELIAGGTLTADASGVPGPVSIYDDVSVLSDEDIVNESINDLIANNDLPEGDQVDDEITYNPFLTPWFGGSPYDGDVPKSNGNEEDEDYFTPPSDQPDGVKPGDGLIDDAPYDANDLVDTEVNGEGGGIKDWLSKAYDKLGIQGILGILSLLGLGKAAGASGRDDQLSGGGIGSFASSQFDPSGFGATAD